MPLVGPAFGDRFVQYYGVHKGGDYLAQRPYKEDAPRHAGRNFYFTQEDLLKEYAEQHRWKYVITRPNIIIGVARGNFMNFATSLANEVNHFSFLGMNAAGTVLSIIRMQRTMLDFSCGQRPTTESKMKSSTFITAINRVFEPFGQVWRSSRWDTAVPFVRS